MINLRKTIKADKDKFINVEHIQYISIQGIKLPEGDCWNVYATISGKEHLIKSFKSKADAIEFVNKIIDYCKK